MPTGTDLGVTLRWGELAVAALRGMVLSREDVRLSKASLEQLVSRLHTLGLNRTDAVDLAEWLVNDVAKRMFALIRDDEAAGAAGGDNPPADGSSGPPSDDDIPF